MLVLGAFPGFCYPIYERVSPQELRESVDELFVRLGTSTEDFIGKLLHVNVTTINLTHLPGLTGQDRWLKFNGQHARTQDEGGDEALFTQPLDELEGTFLGRLMSSTFEQHEKKFGTPFRGRCQLIASRPGFSYPMHTDAHTEHRYHIPVFTDPYFMFAFEGRKRDITLVHMPADGRTWYLNPRDIKHTVVHLGSKPRLHVLLTTAAVPRQET